MKPLEQKKINRLLDSFPGDEPQRFIINLERKPAQGRYLAGWMSYELGYLLGQQLTELLPLSRQGSPLFSFGVFAEAIFCSNSVRGVVQVRLAEESM